MERQLIYASQSAKHCSKILTKLVEQFSEGRNCDLEIRLNNAKIYAHKCLVDIFFPQVGAELEDDRFYLDLRTYDEDVILPLVDMIYSGELFVKPFLVLKVLRAANFLGYSEATKGCNLYMQSHSVASDSEENSATVKQEPKDETSEPVVVRNPISKVRKPVIMDEFTLRSIQDQKERERLKDIQKSIISEEPAKNVYQVITMGQKQKTLNNQDVQKVLEKVKSSSADKNLNFAQTFVSDCIKGKLSDKLGKTKTSDKNKEEAGRGKGKKGNKNKKSEAQKGKQTKDLSKPEVYMEYVGEDEEVLQDDGKKKAKECSESENESEASVAESSDKDKSDKDVSTASQSLKRKHEDKTDKESESEDVRGSGRSLRTKKRINYYKVEQKLDDIDNDFRRMKKKPKTKVSKVSSGVQSGRSSSLTSPMSSQGYVSTVSNIAAFSESSESDDSSEEEGFDLSEISRGKLDLAKLPRFHKGDNTMQKGNLKFIPAVGTVPKGCKSSYAQPLLVETKFVTEMITTPEGNVKVVTKEVPVKSVYKRFTPAPVEAAKIVVCHPTKPVVRF